MALVWLDDDARLTIAASSLGSPPQDVINRADRGLQHLRIPARPMFLHEGRDFPHLELGEAGLIRVRQGSGTQNDGSARIRV